MAVGLQEESYRRELQGSGVLPVPFNAAATALRRTIPFINGLGTDGYLVTRQGAEKLLDIVRRNRITMEVDWFLFFHSMSSPEREEFIRSEGSGRFDALTFAKDKLETCVLFPFLVEQTEEESTINFSNPGNRVPRAELLPVSNGTGSPTTKP
jgi:GR25 family glycosyltransferase involved in LPS biosynthesis